MKNIYVINYKSNDHPLVNSLLGRIIDRFIFLGLSFVFLRVSCACMCVCTCVGFECVRYTKRILILFSSIQRRFTAVLLLLFSVKRLSLFNCTWRSCVRFSLSLFSRSSRSRVSSARFRSDTRARRCRFPFRFLPAFRSFTDENEHREFISLCRFSDHFLHRFRVLLFISVRT